MEMGKCPKCNDTGIVKEARGIHVCWDCLQNGKINGYSEKVKAPKLDHDYEED